ncbi:MAG: DUF3301 domain-containing protein [Endozoicomonas sp.]
MDVIFWMAAAAIVLWYWADTTKARELAIAHGRRACRDLQHQFLDGTVVRYRTRTARSSSGQVCLARDFSFEFTTDGINRYPGHIRMLGQRLQMLDLQYQDPDHDSTSNLILSTTSRDEECNGLRTRAETGTDCSDREPVLYRPPGRD